MKRSHVVIGSLVAAVISGCAQAPSFLSPASPVARQEATLFEVILGLSVGVFVVVEGLLLYNLLHHRKKPTPQGIPPQRYRDYFIEATYTGVPILIVVVIFILMSQTLRAVAIPVPMGNDVRVQIIGHQWWWEFDYPDLNIHTANELHIPVNTTVLVDLTSLDVIHSFWVPQLSGKTDVIPGLTNQMWLQGDTVGQYYGQCSEYCGANHANMRVTVFVDSQEDFDAWVANQQKPPVDPQGDLEQAGHDLITTGVCSACHNLGDSGPGNAIGPNLTHLMSRTTFAGGIFPINEANLRRWLQDTQAMKPGNDMNHPLTAQEIDALMAYLVTLK